jgi:hypothetical protein
VSGPAALVAKLVASLHAGEQTGPEAARTFAAAVGRWLAGETLSLDVALGSPKPPGSANSPDDSLALLPVIHMRFLSTQAGERFP